MVRITAPGATLFYLAAPRPLPPWILGVLVVLTANWRLMCLSHLS